MSSDDYLKYKDTISQSVMIPERNNSLGESTEESCFSEVGTEPESEPKKAKSSMENYVQIK